MSHAVPVHVEMRHPGQLRYIRYPCEGIPVQNNLKNEPIQNVCSKSRFANSLKRIVWPILIKAWGSVDSIILNIAIVIALKGVYCYYISAVWGTLQVLLNTTNQNFNVSITTVYSGRSRISHREAPVPKAGCANVFFWQNLC